MLKRLLRGGCPVYRGPRLAPRPCALSLEQDSLPPAGPEQGLGPGVRHPLFLPPLPFQNPVSVFLSGAGPRASTHPGLLACVLPCINPTSQGLSLVLYPFLTKEPAQRVSTPKRLQLLLSGHPVAVCLHPHLNKREDPEAGMLAVWQCTHPPPSPAPCALDLSLSFLACPGGWKLVQVDPGVCLGVGSLITPSQL